MKVLITGGSGFLGSALTRALQQQGVKGQAVKVTWVSRTPYNAIANQVISYDELATTEESFDIIINLAGAGIADSRWSNERKKVLLESRIGPTQALLDYIHRIATKPKLFISGSAIGWYGAQAQSDPTALDETAQPGTDFAHELCQTWEQLALTANTQLPLVIIRTGVVISPAGGMVGRLITPFKLGTGGKLGNGQQVMSWISREDWVQAVIFIIEKNLSVDIANYQQIYNLTAPSAITNEEFTHIMSQWLHRPTVMSLPAFAVKAMFGEMSTLLLDGQRVMPKALLDQGYRFKDTDLLAALTHTDN